MEEETKIRDLRPGMKRVSVRAKVLNIGEPIEITTRFGEVKHVSEAVIGDETGVVRLSLWEDQRNEVQEGKTIFVENGYTTLVRGHLRLNVGKYGAIKDSKEEIEEVDEENDMSEKEFSQERRGRRGNFRRGRRF